MILVGVGGDDVIQMADTLLFQEGVDQIGVSCVATVDQHGFAVTDHQCRVCLPHIDKVDLKSAGVGDGRGRCGFRLSRLLLLLRDIRAGTVILRVVLLLRGKGLTRLCGNRQGYWAVRKGL